MNQSQAAFAGELARLRAEEEAAKSAASELSAQLAVARREGAAVAAAAADAAALEERYWHGLNDYHAMLAAHVTER
jgi:hypothetical protein